MALVLMPVSASADAELRTEWNVFTESYDFFKGLVEMR